MQLHVMCPSEIDVGGQYCPGPVRICLDFFFCLDSVRGLSVRQTEQGRDRAVRTFGVLVRRRLIRDPIRKPIQVKEETIIVFPKSSGPPLREVISQTINAGDRILEGRESPNPADMRDGRIVDYTLNKRLFPVPLFPNHQKLPTNDDIRYARISVPVRIISVIIGLLKTITTYQK